LRRNGVGGATTTTSRRRGGSDHTSFNEAGLPGIGVAQDPIEYGSHTWHTNLDTYERVIESDAQASAMAIASAVYHLAMREEKLPRLDVHQFAGTIAFVGYSLAQWENTIWYRRKVATTLRNTLDGLIYGVLTGGVFGWLWP
jgi:Zn-dependent M28 family amino/carboxypeptidase